MFLGNSDEIYENFFGSYSPLHHDFELDGSDVFGSLLSDAFGGKKQPQHKKPADIEEQVTVTLKELYNGSVKTLKYKRMKVYPDGRTLIPVEEEFKF